MRVQDEALCDAIRQKKMVEMLYDDDVEYRLFAPTAVYYDSPSKDNILVDGLLVHNPAESWERNVNRSYELSKVKKVELIDDEFEVLYFFTSPEDKYEHGYICVADRP